MSFHSSLRLGPYLPNPTSDPSSQSTFSPKFACSLTNPRHVFEALSQYTTSISSEIAESCDIGSRATGRPRSHEGLLGSQCRVILRSLTRDENWTQLRKKPRGGRISVNSLNISSLKSKADHWLSNHPYPTVTTHSRKRTIHLGDFSVTSRALNSILVHGKQNDVSSSEPMSLSLGSPSETNEVIVHTSLLARPVHSRIQLPNLKSSLTSWTLICRTSISWSATTPKNKAQPQALPATASLADALADISLDVDMDTAEERGHEHSEPSSSRDLGRTSSPDEDIISLKQAHLNSFFEPHILGEPRTPSFSVFRRNVPRRYQPASTPLSCLVPRTPTKRSRDLIDGLDEEPRKKPRLTSPQAPPSPTTFFGSAASSKGKGKDEGSMSFGKDGDNLLDKEVETGSTTDGPKPVVLPDTDSTTKNAVNWWKAPSLEAQKIYDDKIAAARASFAEEEDLDASMVHDYSAGIYDYVLSIEHETMPDPNYMDNQADLEWRHRATVIEWMIQVHTRYNWVLETLWIAANIVDRFLSSRTVSLVKLHLVALVALFIAVKFEEIHIPKVAEFVYLSDHSFAGAEIAHGEAVILKALEWKISNYCTPYIWLRRISKADDYDLHTRTLAKYIMEVCLIDHHFLSSKPSQIAALAMHTSRTMLAGNGAWDDTFIFYSGYVEEQLKGSAFERVVRAIAATDFEDKHVYKKYATTSYLKASIFARDWAKEWVRKEEEANEETMAVDV